MRQWIHVGLWVHGCLNGKRPAARSLLWLIHMVGLLIGLSLAPAAHGQTSTPADEPQIFGGQEAQPGAWPWQAALVWADTVDAYWGQYCGGTLIAPQWVLTAADCVDDIESSQVDVVLGRHLLSSQEGERIASDQIIVHPNYNYSEMSDVLDLDGDIALIHLATASAQQPAVLYRGPPGQEETQFIAGTVTGWGITESLSFPDALLEVLVPLASPAVCARTYGDLLTENMICAGYAKGYKGPCYGDSGGPLVVRSQDGAGWLQIGVVSWGRGCGEPNGYGVYTRVASYREWLDGCLANTASHACIGGDAYEPDDQAQRATRIQIDGSPQMHNFHLRTDRDWMKLEAQAGSFYLIDAQPVGEGSDPLVWLYDSDGVTPLAYDDDSGVGRAAELVWRAPRTDTLYVEVQDLAGGRGKRTEYSVRVQTVMLTVYLPLAAR